MGCGRVTCFEHADVARPSKCLRVAESSADAWRRACGRHRKNLSSRVCALGAQHRYDAAYRRLVASVRRAYGVKGRGCRIDHLVPIELGGAPFDRANLWPQPIDESHVKDRIENAARAEVCSGRASLVDEQRAFERNWTTVR